MRTSPAAVATLVAALVALAAPVSAAEPGGCDAFAWPLATEIGWITAPDRLQVKSGATIESVPERAVELALVPQADAVLAALPTGSPAKKPDAAFAGTVRFAAPQKPGLFQVTLSTGGWIDVIQGGAALKDVAHTGKLDCPHARKSVRFEIGGDPFIVQITSAPSSTIVITVKPSD